MKYSLMTTSGLVDFPNTGSVFKSRIPPQWGGTQPVRLFLSGFDRFYPSSNDADWQNCLHLWLLSQRM